MVQAKLTEKFKGVPDGEVYPRWFAKGAVLTGSLAEAALSCGVAKPVGGPAENKMMPDTRGARFQPDLEAGDGGDTGQRAKPKPRGRGSRKASAKRG